MDTVWKDYLNRYANDPFYWFQPKGFTVSQSNLAVIQQKLRLLRQFAGQPWRKAQRRYTDALRRARLFDPRQARRETKDYSAIARMNKVVFDSLGLAWITDRSVIEITDAGDTFLKMRDGQLPTLVAQQLCRYLYPNPVVGRDYADAGVFPYLALLAVLTHFPGGIPSECYELFISRMKSDRDVHWAVEHIRRFKSLKNRDRAGLIDRLERLPILSDGRIVAGGRRTSLFNTIRLNRSYMVSFLKTPGLIEEGAGVLRLAHGRHAEAESLVQDHLQNQCYIDFASPEDWIAFYGQLDRQPNHEEALAYYRLRGDVERSAEVFRSAKSTRKLAADLRDLDERSFRKLQILERTLEDFLEFNLHLLEDGLTFVARQHPTATGPLDILAKDAKGCWVVIELKRGQAAERVIGQLMRYRGFIIRERGKGRGHRVRGFVVAPDPDKRLVEAAKGATPAPIEVFQFDVRGHAERLFPSATLSRRRSRMSNSRQAK